MEEIWKPVKDYEGYYEISSLGRLRSCDRIIEQGKNHLQIKGRIRRVGICKSTGEVQRQLGYNKLNIGRCCRGERPTAYGYKWRYVI